jgi:hypothetical protein
MVDFPDETDQAVRTNILRQPHPGPIRIDLQTEAGCRLIQLYIGMPGRQGVFSVTFNDRIL